MFIIHADSLLASTMCTLMLTSNTFLDGPEVHVPLLELLTLAGMITIVLGRTKALPVLHIRDGE